ncbi:MAG: sensor signal transduction histidine kinase [Planctomycetaceae bacterium]|nr:sensor signal transduction histidine kinase [Planctomycetaceae bacterium]
MEMLCKDPAEEIKQLQRCNNDLVSLLALPALCTGGDSSQIARTLVDVLQRMLSLELVYVVLKDPLAEMPEEFARVTQSALQPREIGAELQRLLGDDPQKWPSRASRRFVDKDLSIVPARLGLHGEIGMVVVGTERSDFPSQTEELILRMATNQAAIALRETRLLNEQKRVAEELDQRVAQRTKELASANQELQLQVGLLQLIPVAAWTILPNGTTDFVNNIWLEYTGQELDYVLSTPAAWMTVVHPDDRDVASTTFWEGIRTGQGFAMETRFRRIQDGAYRWHLNRAVALRDPNGKVVKFVGTSTDIDDQKKAQDTLRNTQAELANMTRATTMGQLTASIAHEVNQPLSGIITNAGTCLRMLDAHPPNIEGARETANRTIRDGNRASEVVMRLRALFSKRQAVTEPVDLNEAAMEVVALLLSQLQKCDVMLRSDFDEDLPLIVGDRVQLQQVIMNLLQNACDAMSNVHDRSRQLLIQTHRDDGGNVRLMVQDNGTGLDPEAVNRVFDPFYTTKNGGMGIGLSVSRSIIENHQGRIWVKPNDGPGATFSFSIPLSAGRTIRETLVNLTPRSAATNVREIAQNLDE